MTAQSNDSKSCDEKTDDVYLNGHHKLNQYSQKQKNNANNSQSFVNAVIIGNVNAGKSSLCGRIAYHLGDVSGPTLLEYRKQAQELQRESYYLAWWSDRASIEREKGITIHNHFHCWSFPERN